MSVFKHAKESEHRHVKIDDFQVMQSGLTNYYRRTIAEALHIKESQPSLNEQNQLRSLSLLN